MGALAAMRLIFKGREDPIQEEEPFDEVEITPSAAGVEGDLYEDSEDPIDEVETTPSATPVEENIYMEDSSENPEEAELPPWGEAPCVYTHDGEDPDFHEHVPEEGFEGEFAGCEVDDCGQTTPVFQTRDYAEERREQEESSWV